MPLSCVALTMNYFNCRCQLSLEGVTIAKFNTMLLLFVIVVTLIVRIVTHIAFKFLKVAHSIPSFTTRSLKH